MIRNLQLPRSLWPIFVPLTLAIIAGILMADVVRAGVGGLAEAKPRPVVQQTRTNPMSDDGDGRASRRERGAAEPVQRVATLQTLPGPITARRSGARASCIHGTIAYRSGNGWEQGLANDVPLRCRSDSN